MSKKVIVGADGAATVSDASLADLVTTLFSTDSALTGTYGLLQKAALVYGGMTIQSVRLGNGWNALKA